jgi:FdhE protein
MTRDQWLAAHAFLRPVASLDERVVTALSGLRIESPRIPDWEAYAEEFGAGVPVLASQALAIDLEPAGRTVVALVDALAAGTLPSALDAQLRQLRDEIRRDVAAPRRLVDWLLGDDGFAPSTPGLLRYVGWLATARSLGPLVAAYGSWRNDERWLHPHCPTCGTGPAMAQLIGTDPGRKRYLSCGCCRTRWQFGRTRCPFCRVDVQRVAVVTITGEGGLRIDSCELCKGYIKTLEGVQDEALLMADWSSLHLDVLAHDRGLKRLATSLYDLGSMTSAAGNPV